MESEQRRNRWLTAAAIVGVVLAVALTAVIWFQVIDRQATAMLSGETVVPGTPWPVATPDAYAPDAGTAPRPIP